MVLRPPDISEFNELKREVDNLKQLVTELRQELKAHIGKEEIHQLDPGF